MSGQKAPANVALDVHVLAGLFGEVTVHWGKGLEY